MTLYNSETLILSALEEETNNKVFLDKDNKTIKVIYTGVGKINATIATLKAYQLLLLKS